MMLRDGTRRASPPARHSSGQSILPYPVSGRQKALSHLALKNSEQLYARL